MNYMIFIALLGSIGIIGAFLFSHQSKWHIGRILVPLLAMLLCAAGFIEYFASSDDNLVQKVLWVRCAVVLHYSIALLLLEIVVSFLGKEGIGSPLKIGNRPLRLRYLWRPLFIIALEIVVFAPWFDFVNDTGNIVVQLNQVGELLFGILFCYYLVILYSTEKLFRNTTPLQKRIFSLFLASIGIIALGSMVLLVRILFFKIIAFQIVQIHAVLSSIFFCGMLLGLARYRLWQEQVIVDRGVVYTSVTIVFFGVFLVLLGILAFLIQILGVRFNDFESFVVLFSVLFAGMTAIFSSRMRKEITRFTRTYIYKSKYDYRDQLLRLHQVHQTTGNLADIVLSFINNIRYAIIVENAHVFIRSANNNSFVRLDDPLFPVKEHYSLRPNSPLVRMFEDGAVSAIGIADANPDIVSRALDAERPLIDKLAISHLFSVRYDNNLMGVLGIKSGKRSFDSEDLMLITIFCESIGAAIFRDRIERDRIEQKQFESFSHMASFIVHDIKNQVATLSLVTKNAREHITNPEFHPVLLRCLESSSDNLRSLVEKLQSPPNKELLAKAECACNEIVDSIIETSRASLPAGIELTFTRADIPTVTVDPTALSYVLKNLLINAIEALGGSGRITCSTALLSDMVMDDTCGDSLSPGDREKYRTIISVEDNGPGMSRSFREQRLFKPFNTTKDKGIGIGLYQCKTLIETMGGRLLCFSEEGKGTRFCILLS
jgi:putative PEP-CTERM system histidine kinase